MMKIGSVVADCGVVNSNKVILTVAPDADMEENCFIDQLKDI